MSREPAQRDDRCAEPWQAISQLPRSKRKPRATPSRGAPRARGAPRRSEWGRPVVRAPPAVGCGHDATAEESASRASEPRGPPARWQPRVAFQARRSCSRVRCRRRRCRRCRGPAAVAVSAAARRSRTARRRGTAARSRRGPRRAGWRSRRGRTGCGGPSRSGGRRAARGRR